MCFTKSYQRSEVDLLKFKQTMNTCLMKHANETKNSLTNRGICKKKLIKDPDTNHSVTFNGQLLLNVIVRRKK